MLKKLWVGNRLPELHSAKLNAWQSCAEKGLPKDSQGFIVRIHFLAQ